MGGRSGDQISTAMPPHLPCQTIGCCVSVQEQGIGVPFLGRGAAVQETKEQRVQGSRTRAPGLFLDLLLVLPKGRAGSRSLHYLSWFHVKRHRQPEASTGSSGTMCVLGGGGVGGAESSLVEKPAMPFAP